MLHIRTASDEQRSTVQVRRHGSRHSFISPDKHHHGRKKNGPNNRLQVPNQPTIPFIEGDGIGPDIWKASVRVFDAAIQKSISWRKKIHWLKVLAGEALTKPRWMPKPPWTLSKEYLLSIKGPLTTPVGGGIRSSERGTAPELDLYANACAR